MISINNIGSQYRKYHVSEILDHNSKGYSVKDLIDKQYVIMINNCLFIRNIRFENCNIIVGSTVASDNFMLSYFNDNRYIMSEAFRDLFVSEGYHKKFDSTSIIFVNCVFDNCNIDPHGKGDFHYESNSLRFELPKFSSVRKYESESDFYEMLPIALTLGQALYKGNFDISEDTLKLYKETLEKNKRSDVREYSIIKNSFVSGEINIEHFENKRYTGEYGYKIARFCYKDYAYPVLLKLRIPKKNNKAIYPICSKGGKIRAKKVILEKVYLLSAFIDGLGRAMYDPIDMEGLEIYDASGDKLNISEFEPALYNDTDCVYKIGEETRASNFADTIKGCDRGIHFFETINKATNYLKFLNFIRSKSTGITFDRINEMIGEFTIKNVNKKDCKSICMRRYKLHDLF